MRKAVVFATESREGIGMVTKVMYPRIAKTFKTTPSRVERAIRHAIEVAWERSDTETWQNIFGLNISKERGRPSNSEFIAMISEQFRIQSEEDQ
jgi:two-component system response regulator (stage 0 sporulation protein A)